MRIHWPRRLWHAGAALCLLFVAMLPAAPAAEFTALEIIGDSVSAGANPATTSLYGWAHMLQGVAPPNDAPCTAPLQTIYSLWPQIKVHNAAQMGAHTGVWANTQGPAFQGLAARRPDLVIILLGGNDLQAAYQDGVMTREDLLALRNNLRWIVQQLKALPSAPEIIMLNYYDCFDGLSEKLPLPLYHGYSYYVARANDLLATVARLENCRLVNIHGAFLNHGYGRDLGGAVASLQPPYFTMPLSKYDVHCLTAGHWRIYREVMAALEELKKRPPK